MKTTEKGNKLLNFIIDKFENNELLNGDLVENIKLSGGYLNLRTITKYAKDEGITYQGVLKRPDIDIVELFGVKFVIDND